MIYVYTFIIILLLFFDLIKICCGLFVPCLVSNLPKLSNLHCNKFSIENSYTVIKFSVFLSLSQAVVTSHLVVRGSYRSLSLVIYGNTAGDLGQFNIEFDDNALTDLVDSTEGKLEDLPLALHSNNFATEDSRSSLRILSIPVPAADISLEVKLFLQLMLKILEFSELGDDGHKVVSTLVSAISSYISGDISESISGKYQIGKRPEKFEELHSVVNEARKELLEVYRVFQQKSGSESAECSSEGDYLELEAEILDSKTLVDIFNQINHFRRKPSPIEDHCLSRVIYCSLTFCTGISL